MDHQQLLQEIKESLKESHVEMRQDIKDLSNKLDNYQERLIQLESTVGFIRASLVTSLGAVGAVCSYLIYKVIDLFSMKG